MRSAAEFRRVVCPTCGVSAGEHCRSKDGRPTPVHTRRLGAYIDAVGRDEFIRRHYPPRTGNDTGMTRGFQGGLQGTARHRR